MDQKKYYTVEEAAQILGMSPGEVNQKRERNELRGFRDGSNWKFKVEDIEAIVRELRGRKSQPVPPAGEEAPDLLLSEVELGGSDSVVSGTVLGAVGKAAADSDIQLADSHIEIAGIKTEEEGVSGTMAKYGSAGSGGLDITLDDDALLDENQMDLSDEDSGTVANVPGPAGLPMGPAASKPDSSLNLASDSALSLAGSSPLGFATGGSGSKKLDDDDIVLGGGSSGSDITIGGDSGISLLDPTDSGLSLEEPLELDRMDDDSLELGEDDMLTFSEDAGVESPAVKKDEEFLLTPLEEAADDEESESGSQVIALDSAPVSDSTATMIAGSSSPLSAAGLGGMASMLEEAVADAPAAPGFQAAPGFAPMGPMAPAGMMPGMAPMGMGGQPMYSPDGTPMGAGAGPMVLPEAPYSGLNVFALTLCVLLLVLCSVITFDMMRNMWSWNGTYGVNSWLMDTVLGLFG